MEEIKKELEQIRQRYGDEAFQSVIKSMKIKTSRRDSVAEKFRQACPSISVIESKGYTFYVLSSNLQDIADKLNVKISAEELKKFDELQSSLLVVGKFFKNKE
jgi:ABC-type sulfate transport system substrate-binding protein